MPLGNLVSYDLASSAPLIQHYNLFHSASITGNAAEGYSSGEAIAASASFIFGMIPLVFASGAGANSRVAIGWTVIGGMLAVTLFAIFIVPLMYSTITRWAYSEEELAAFRE